MSDKSRISWTDATWNPVTGCSRVSPGCDHCYAERLTAGRLSKQPRYANLTDQYGQWSGELRCHPDLLEVPLRWTKPRRIFVCSTSDLFHPKVPWEFILRVFDVMAAADRHTFQVVTKRPGRMAYFAEQVWPKQGGHWDPINPVEAKRGVWPGTKWPAHVWAGTSVESQKYAPRLDCLARVPAKVRFVSVEPLLGPVDLWRWLTWTGDDGMKEPPQPPVLHWVIVGGESGPGARPMHEDWVRNLRDQCSSSGVAFFYKQAIISGRKIDTPMLDGRQWKEFPDALQRSSEAQGFRP